MAEILKMAENNLYKYLEVTLNNGSVVKRLDVSGESDLNIEKIESGMNQNLNHNEYSIETIKSQFELPKI